ncbi:hypothetical protein [Antrihabitans spumae]|uniref:Prepilin type IV endopeptidase peptidase domain-containing protein n=1 Tax=Antrihabitans spumae TaxID=3373370 RepID=A0ABW7JK11_9NOCA
MPALTITSIVIGTAIITTLIVAVLVDGQPALQMLVLFGVGVVGAIATVAVSGFVAEVSPLEAAVQDRMWIPGTLAGLLWVGAVLTLQGPFLVGCLVVAVFAVWAGRVDHRSHCLPIELTTITGVVAAGTVAVAGVVGVDGGSTLAAFVAAAGLGAVLTVIGAATGMFAFGDVLLAVPLALLIGFWAVPPVVLLPFVASVLAVPATIVAAVRARSMSVELPFGPALIAAAALLLGVATP